MNLLQDKVAIITGGSRGIGEAIVRKFAENGARIAFTYISDSSKERSEKLVAELITAFSNEGDLIYDPFMGIGTTAVVSKKLSRRFVGSEIVKEYCRLANSRALELTLFA